MKKLLLFLCLTVALIKPSAAQDNQAICAEIERYAQQIMSDWQIPGMAIAIAKDGELIYKKGFGVKSLEGKQPVDENTVFQIGSVSKSFTAALVAMLVDEGKLSWNDPVRKHLPDFEMYDPWVSENLLVKDIMVHRTGLPGQAGTYIPNLGYDRDDIYRMLHIIKPSTSVRTSYDYNNITFIIAAKLIEKYTGKTWEQNLQERILTPLGMTASSSNGDGYLASKNVSDSYEYEFENGKIKLKYLQGDDRALHWLTVVGPAGSVNASITDLIKWPMFHLNKGKINGKELITKKNVDFLHTGQTITRQDSVTTSVYGQCWFIEQNNRYRLYFHTGTTWGFTTLVAFVPELKLGFAMLVNAEAPASPRYAVMRRLIDLYKNDGVNKDYNKEYLEKFYKDSNEDEAKSKKKQEEQKAAFTPPLTLSVYVGKYSKELFGDAEVALKNGKLWITVGPKKWESQLQHVSGNKFSFRTDGHTFPITFEPDYNGKIVSLNIDFGYKENFGSWMKKGE